MSRYVLDTFAIMAMVRDEPGSGRVKELFGQRLAGQATLFMSWMNVGEVVYITERRYGQDRVPDILLVLERELTDIVTVGRQLSLRAAHIKANYPMSYTDACAAALAIWKDAILVTGDPEFASMATSLSIEWLPQQR